MDYEQEEQKNTKSFIVLWAFHPDNGNPYIDSMVEITAEQKIRNTLKLGEDKEIGHQLTMLSFRQRFSNTKVALFHVPEGTTPDDMHNYFAHEDREKLLEKLKLAKFSL